MIFPQFVIYMLIYDYLKFRKDPSITSQEIVNYISVALAVALSVWACRPSWSCDPDAAINFRPPYPRGIHIKVVFDWPSGFGGEDV